jgi:predicted AAA+ superfamily ATPase
VAKKRIPPSGAPGPIGFLLGPRTDAGSSPPGSPDRRQRRPSRWIILDEIQKIPSLLEEVHRLNGNANVGVLPFAAPPSRKLKRGGADLLGGSRALTSNLESFSRAELGPRFDLSRALAFGTLPLVCNAPQDAPAILHAYVNTYIKEEIKEEGVVRHVPPFLRFLLIAGLMNGQMVNASNIAAQAGVARTSVDNYFSILVDTLLGSFPSRVPARSESKGKGSSEILLV